MVSPTCGRVDRVAVKARRARERPTERANTGLPRLMGGVRWWAADMELLGVS